MAYKHIWYRNFNGGPFLGLTEVKFDSGTDARAFESVLNTLKTRIERNTPRGRVIYDFVFASEVERKIAGRYKDELKEILGLLEFYWYEGGVTVIPVLEKGADEA